MKTYIYYIHALSLIIFALGLFLVTPALAAVRCETQYGGNEVCVRTGNLQVNKEVFDPQRNIFVDNLTLNDHRFTPGEEVRFKITVKNVGDATLDNVNVMDTLPNMLTSGDGNPFFQLKDLAAGKSEEREIKVKVVGADKFPADKSVLCVVNSAEAVSGDNKDHDAAQLCLERKVFPKQLPPTGPEHWFMALFGSFLAGTTGIYLLKFSKKNTI